MSERVVADLAGRVAIVTGGAGGIGRGIAVRLGARGATVVVNGRSEERAACVVDEIRTAGGAAHFHSGDVGSLKDMQNLVQSVVDQFGRIDIVVPNAGGFDDQARDPKVRGPFVSIDLERVANFAGQALLGKLAVVQASVPHLQENGGSVVFVTSEGGRAPTPGQTGIAAFSAALIQVSKLLSKELARDKIRVNCVCVTVVRDTPSWQAAFEHDDSVSVAHRRQYEKIVERAPFGIASAPDIGDVVSFLASDESMYLTGAVLSPTGGLTLH
jgi:3-oxoacyl-[acyl-carrier protein] reductase